MLETLNKIKEARLKITLNYDEMLDVKKYMFKELLTFKTNDKELIENDFNYVSSLKNLDPNNVDKTKLSQLGLLVLYIIFGGYISIVSSKRCGEDFNITNVKKENENDYQKYGFNVNKKMYLKYIMQTYTFTNNATISMITQLMKELDVFNENFFVFKLNENKSLLLVNSFFRLHFDSYPDKKAFLSLNLDNYTSLPSTSALIPNDTVLAESRRYKYEFHELDLESVEYINSLC